MPGADRVALVTGGAWGSAGRRLDRLGGRRRPGLPRRPGRARPRAGAGGARERRARAVVADLGSVAGCERAVGAALAWGGRLDVLVNCAGLWVEGPTDTMTEADWDRVVDVNLKGTFFMCRYAIPALEETGGCIVNVSSDAGLWGNKGAAIYSASKGGVSCSPRRWPSSSPRAASGRTWSARATWTRR